MGNVGSIYRKETRAYWVSPIPYVVIAIFAGLMAYRFFAWESFFVLQRASLDSAFFEDLEKFLCVLAPLFSMRLWSEEARAGTLETLMTLPVSSTAMVVGKFLAAWTVVGLALLSTVGLALTASSLGDLDWGPVVGGYLGAVLLSGALLAIGAWISSLTNHQLVAYICTALVGGLFLLMQMEGEQSTGLWHRLMREASLTAHYTSLGRGLLDVRDLFYFGSVTFFFLYLNVQSIENRRYR